jgi:hypothetical protein
MARTIHRSPGRCAFFVRARLTACGDAAFGWLAVVGRTTPRRGRGRAGIRSERVGSRSQAEPSERSDYRPTEERAGSTAGRGRLSSTARVLPASGRGRQSGWSALVRSAPLGSASQLAHSGATPPSTARSGFPRVPNRQAMGWASGDGCLPARRALPAGMHRTDCRARSPVGVVHPRSLGSASLRKPDTLTRGPPLPRPRRLCLRHGAAK